MTIELAIILVAGILHRYWLLSSYDPQKGDVPPSVEMAWFDLLWQWPPMVIVLCGGIGILIWLIAFRRKRGETPAL